MHITKQKKPIWKDYNYTNFLTGIYMEYIFHSFHCQFLYVVVSQMCSNCMQLGVFSYSKIVFII